MKITKSFFLKKEFPPFDFWLGFVFFLLFGYILYLYRLDYLPLAVSLLLILYPTFIKKIEDAPAFLDLCFLAALAISLSFFLVYFLGLSVYTIPAIGFAMLITLLFDQINISLLFSFFVASLGLTLAKGDLAVGVSLFAGALLVSRLSWRLRHRFDLIKAGFLAGLFQFLIALMINKGKGFFFSFFDLHLLYICVITGTVSAVLVIGLLPIFEFLFKVITNLSLLELSDFNRPLLRRLILEAPGTYQHSLLVANLSESAAEAIGANSLLVRVGAYYHDIGKVFKPNYFVENFVGHRDAHRGLKPSLSKLIILNHVREGVELAKQHALNPKIIDFIREHHGRTLVYFFYHKAKALEPNEEHEEEYRYPGPKPQSKENAIVFLADTIEALSRTLEEPTPARIGEMVREVVKKRFLEGELDECNLTFKELEKITQSFIRMLNAIFHTRINYPRDEDRNK